MAQKRSWVITAILIAVIGLIAAQGIASAGSVADGALSLTNIGVTPQPVVAGSNITITFQLYNSYASALNNVALQLQSPSQLFNVSPSSSYLIYGIGTGLYGGLGYNQIQYRVHIPANIQAGAYIINVVATYDTTSGAADIVGQSVMPLSIYIYGKPQLKLTAVPSQSITPGQQSTITISAINTGTDIARNVSITIANSNAFKVVGTPAFNLGNIGTGATASLQTMLLASQNLYNNTYPLNLQLAYTSNVGVNSTSNVSLPISVLIPRPNIITTIISSSPPQLYAGSNQTITVGIENIGLGQAKNVSALFLSTNGITVNYDAPFFIGNIASGGTATETLVVQANRNATKANYTIPVLLNYTASNQTLVISKTYQMPIKLTSAGVFQITNTSSTLKPGATYAPITFTIRNTGSATVQQVSLSLQTSFPVTVANPTSYINQLEPGQSQNATFYVNIDTKANAGTYPVTLYEQWTQPNTNQNQQFFSSENYYAQVAPQNTGSKSTGNYAIIGVAVVIAVVVVFIFRTRIAKKRHK